MDEGIRTSVFDSCCVSTTATAATATATTVVPGTGNTDPGTTLMPSTKGQKLAPFNPTHIDAINLAIDMLSVSSEDTVYDLGCGDGRFLLQCLAYRGICKGVGIEYDYSLVERAVAHCLCGKGQQNASKLQILHENVLDVDFSEATIIFVYLVPDGIKAIR